MIEYILNNVEMTYNILLMVFIILNHAQTRSEIKIVEKQLEQAIEGLEHISKQIYNHDQN